MKNDLEKALTLAKAITASLIVALVPLFFLPFTQEYYVTGKLYLLAFGSLVLILISTAELLVSKKFVWKKTGFDNLLFLFFVTVGLSIILSSPNKIQAILNPNFGLVLVASLTVLAFYLSRLLDNPESKKILKIAIYVSSALTALLAIIFFFAPFKNGNLPAILVFLKNPSFSTLGSLLDQAIFVGFFAVYFLGRLIFKKEGKTQNQLITVSALFVVNLLALSLTSYTLYQQMTAKDAVFLLPPFRISWYSAVEILKNPMTALFGVGIDNFSSIFTRVKDLAYNQSNLWQVNSFTVSRSALLHIFTEGGVFTAAAFILILLTVAKNVLKNKKTHPELLLVAGFWLLVALLFPISLVVVALFFILVVVVSSVKDPASRIQDQGSVIDLTNLIPFYIGMIVISVLAVGASGYLLVRTYAAEAYFKKSLEGLANNNAAVLYNNMRNAILTDPYIEKFRINFAQTNLLLANNVAAKTTQTDQQGKQYQLTDQERQTISQAIQAAIAEAKAAVALNPQKAGNWENLAVIYRSIINIAQDADAWTIASYQRAIALDPQNPIYRLNLGGVYYTYNGFELATNLFNQATALKADWPNAHYNLAWSEFQRKNYQVAASEMQNVLYLLDPQKDKVDFDRAQKDLEEFKKYLPKTEAEQPAQGQQPAQLNLPTPAPEKVEPPIELPKEASPEAR